MSSRALKLTPNIADTDNVGSRKSLSGVSIAAAGTRERNCFSCGFLDLLNTITITYTILNGC